MLAKIKALLRTDDRSERILSLLEIRLNRVLYNSRVDARLSSNLSTFLSATSRGEPLREVLRSHGEAETAVAAIRDAFHQRIQRTEALFPLFFNADVSFAMLCYGVTRLWKPSLALEAGVGYGISSATILEAMQRNGKGRLVSVDLPPLSDPTSSLIGIAVPDRLRHRWDSSYRGGVRTWLPAILAKEGAIDVFVSDSANVFTLEKFEFQNVWPKLAAGGVMIFNNVNQHFFDFLRKREGVDVHVVRQVEKPSCTTAVVFKK